MAAKTLGTGLTGAFNLGNLFLDRRQFYLEPNTVQELWPSVTPFITIASNKNKITGLADPLFKQFEHRSAFIKQQFTDAVGSKAITADDVESAAITPSSIIGLPAVDASWEGLEFEIWDSTLTTKKGVVVVTSYSTTTIDVKLLSSTAVTTVAGDVFNCIGYVGAEGGVAPEAWADDLKMVWGSTQQIETAVEVTKTLYTAALRGYSKELERLRAEKGKEQAMHIEKVLLFSSAVMGSNLDPDTAESFADTFVTMGATSTIAASKPIRSTMGAVAGLEKYGHTSGDYQNLFNITAASYNYKNFVDNMEKVFTILPTGGEKYFLVGPGMQSYWSKLDGNSYFAGNSGWAVNLGKSETDALGFKVRRLETPHGDLMIVRTPAFRGIRSGHGLILDPANISYVEYEGTQFLNNIKTDNAYKGVKDLYRDDAGCGMTLLESHHMMYLV